MIAALESAKLYIGGGMLAAIIGLSGCLAMEKSGHRATKADLVASELRLSVSNSSIDILTETIADLRDQALDRAALLESARSEAREDAERFARERVDLEATNQRLRALVRPRDGPCPTDEEVLDALDTN